MLETLVVKMLAVVGIFFPGVNREVAMSRPVVELWRSRIAVSCVLQRPLSADLLNVVDSGTPVSLTFICRLRAADGTPARAADTTVTHRIERDLATGTYQIDLGERKLLASRLSEYSPFFRLETVRAWPLDAITSRREYVVEVSARLESIYIHATGETFDLMALWNYREPDARSEQFTRASLARGSP